VNVSPFDGKSDTTGWPFTLRVDESALTGTVEIPQFDRDTFTSAIRLIRDVASIPINLAGFKQGARYVVTIDEMIGPEGRHPLISAVPELARLNTIRKNDIPALMHFLFKDIALQQALSDLILSLDSPKSARINSARVIDAIKHLITPNNSTEKVKWRSMQSALNVTPKYLSLMAEHSIKPRHGQVDDIPPAIAQSLFERSWIVMDRYFQYLLSGRVGLPLDKFPVLDAD
jgi:hypothetical protein